MTLNIYPWNVCGIGRCYVNCLIKDLVFKHNVRILALFETKVNEPKADKIISIMVDTQGSHNQFIHARISSMKDFPSFLVSFVYASPHPSTRNDLWKELSSLASSIQDP
ncbi:hypothetical protein CR513_10418, partial [Mucuna pruriens]